MTRRWTWVVPAFLIALPALGTWVLHETDSNYWWQLRDQMINGTPSATAEPRPTGAGEPGALGTSGTFDEQAPADTTVIREIETITGLVDRHPLIGRKVELHVPVAGNANDKAFWVGEKDNRVLVVPRRDLRDNAARQDGGVAGNHIARLEIGHMAAITGSIQPVPIVEQRDSWGLTNEDREELAARGVYLRADSISVQ
jgi:hypothetical protein